MIDGGMFVAHSSEQQEKEHLLFDHKAGWLVVNKVKELVAGLFFAPEIIGEYFAGDEFPPCWHIRAHLQSHRDCPKDHNRLILSLISEQPGQQELILLLYDLVDAILYPLHI